MAQSRLSYSFDREPPFLAALEGRTCAYCEEGELERDVYKDNQAVVCDTCGTPRAQVWSLS